MLFRPNDDAVTRLGNAPQPGRLLQWRGLGGSPSAAAGAGSVAAAAARAGVSVEVMQGLLNKAANGTLWLNDMASVAGVPPALLPSELGGWGPSFIPTAVRSGATNETWRTFVEPPSGGKVVVFDPGPGVGLAPCEDPNCRRFVYWVTLNNGNRFRGSGVRKTNGSIEITDPDGQEGSITLPVSSIVKIVCWCIDWVYRQDDVPPGLGQGGGAGNVNPWHCTYPDSLEPGGWLVYTCKNAQTGEVRQFDYLAIGYDDKHLSNKAIELQESLADTNEAPSAEFKTHVK